MNEPFKELQELLPLRLDIGLSTILSAYGTYITYFIGGYDALLESLITIIVINYITTLFTALYKNNRQKNFGKFLIQKSSIFFLVTLSHEIDKITGDTATLRNLTIWFFIGNEGLTILKNAVQVGLPIPDALKNKLIQLSQTKTKKVRHTK